MKVGHEGHIELVVDERISAQEAASGLSVERGT